MKELATSAPWPTLLAGTVALALVSIVAAFIRAILKGDLVPRSVLDDARATADKWESAWDRSEDRLDQFEGRLNAIGENADLNTSLLQTLVERSQR